MNKVKKGLAICGALFSAMTIAGDDVIFANGFEPDGPMVVAFTSFEEPVLVEGVNDGKYFDQGFFDVDHDLNNNAGETAVDLTGTMELDIDARWERYTLIDNDPFNNNPIPGMTDGDFAGVTTFTPPNAPFTDGNQGYQMSDPDGTMIIESEAVDLTGMTNNEMSLDYFLAQTTWEIDDPSLGNDIRNDAVRIYAENMVTNDRYYIVDSLTDTPLTTIMDINDMVDGNGVSIVGTWKNASVSLPDDVIVRLVVEFRSGSSSEILWLDNVQFKGM